MATSTEKGAKGVASDFGRKMSNLSTVAQWCRPRSVTSGTPDESAAVRNPFTRCVVEWMKRSGG